MSGVSIAALLLPGEGDVAGKIASYATRQVNLRQAKRTRWFAAAVAFIVLSWLPFTACQAMYKCTQSDGTTAYQDAPCLQSMQEKPFPDTSTQPETPPANEPVNQAPPANTSTPGIPPATQELPAPGPDSTSAGDDDDADGRSANVPVNQPSMSQVKGVLFVALMALIVSIALIVIVVRKAQRQGRSGFAWFLVAFFINPILAWILLAVLGDA